MIKNISILFLTLFLIGCTTPEKPRFSGDHTTNQIRGMWFLCFQKHRQLEPYMNPAVHVEICDCVIDRSRESYGAKEYNGADNLTQFFSKQVSFCAYKYRNTVPA